MKDPNSRSSDFPTWYSLSTCSLAFIGSSRLFYSGCDGNALRYSPLEDNIQDDCRDGGEDGGGHVPAEMHAVGRLCLCNAHGNRHHGSGVFDDIRPEEVVPCPDGEDDGKGPGDGKIQRHEYPEQDAELPRAVHLRGVTHLQGHLV